MKALETSLHTVDFVSCIAQSQAGDGAKTLSSGSPKEIATTSVTPQSPRPGSLSWPEHS